jgi:hypothetical protein
MLIADCRSPSERVILRQQRIAVRRGGEREREREREREKERERERERERDFQNPSAD